MINKQGDILLIPVPFTDLSTNKQRPVLVLSNNIYNQKADDLLVAAITSQLKDIDYSVIINTDDLDDGELKKTSAIRVDKLYTLSKSIVRRKYGHVNSSVIDNLREQLYKLI